MSDKTLAELIKEAQAELRTAQARTQEASARLEELYLLRDLLGKYPHRQPAPPPTPTPGIQPMGSELKHLADMPGVTIGIRPPTEADQGNGVMNIITPTATSFPIVQQTPVKPEKPPKPTKPAQAKPAGEPKPSKQKPAKVAKPEPPAKLEPASPIVRQNSREQVSMRGGVMTRIIGGTNYRCDTRKGTAWEVIRMTDNVVVGEVSSVDREDGDPGFFAKSEKRSGKVHNSPTAAMEQVISWEIGW